MHDTLRGAREFRSLERGAFRSLKWAEPTLVAVEPVYASEMERLYDLLSEREGNFFIFPQLQLFYGLTGKPAPQPLSWFQYGVTYPGPDDVELQLEIDREIVRALKKNDVDLVVLIGNQAQHLIVFPALKSYLMEDFELTGRIGSFFLFDRAEREPGEGE